jgi:phosphate acyltransferase
MPENVHIALDAMGGDHGAAVVLQGAAISLERHPGTKFVMVGSQPVLESLLATRPALRAVTRIVHTDVAVRMDDKPSLALRHGRWKSSMWMAIDAMKKADADVAVSAGNTGALMAMAKFHLKTIAGIDRPALAVRWPTLRGESIVLDVGATIGADAKRLVDLAIMGSAMARALFNVERPTVGILNIGMEEMKGLEEIRRASLSLCEVERSNLNYVGFIGGDDIGKGKVDVVVTEPFVGNIALKTAERTAKQLAELLRGAMSQTLSARIGYLFARKAFKALKEKMDPRGFNGGVFLGLNGLVIKSHGGADAEEFAAAVDLGYQMVHQKRWARISETLGQYPAE